MQPDINWDELGESLVTHLLLEVNVTSAISMDPSSSFRPLFLIRETNSIKPVWLSQQKVLPAGSKLHVCVWLLSIYVNNLKLHILTLAVIMSHKYSTGERRANLTSSFQ